MRITRQKKVGNNGNNVKASAKASLSGRFLFVAGLFGLWAIGIGARLVYLQTAQHDFLLVKAVEQRQRERKVKPLRGSILDRDGRELAVTLEVESLWADPTELENVEGVAYKLAPALGVKPKELLQQIGEAKDGKRRFLWLARELERDQAQRVKDLGLPGLRWQKEQKRFYPHGNLAAQVVGFASRDEVGQAGVELTQDKILRGEPGEITEEFDGKGRVYEIAERPPAQSPRSVALTIDYAVQYRVEQALAAGVKSAKARAGTAVVLDPSNGEILAMATVPTFDLNQPGEVKPEILTNRAVQNMYEPGSTFKLVTYAAALEDAAARPDTTIDASAGFIKIGNRRITDSHPERSALSLDSAFAKSSNVAAVTLGGLLGKERFYDYVKKFGYGTATGVELPAETRGMLGSVEKMTDSSVASLSIGYEIGVTTLQSAAAYAAIANDGVRVAPHLIKEIREEDGRVFAQAQPDERRVVSARTAQNMRRMLAAVTVNGTGKLARVEGYSTGGKTGTAHKFDARARRYSENKYVASFVGLAPADKPAVVIAVMIDEPGAGSHYGGDVAAPIFRDIAELILPELDIAPDAGNRQPNEILTARNNDPIVAPPQISLEEPQEKSAKPEKQAIEVAAKTANKEKETAKNNQKPTDKTAARESAPPKVAGAVKTVAANEPRPRVVAAGAGGEKKNQTPAKPASNTAPKTAKNESAAKPAGTGKIKKT